MPFGITNQTSITVDQLIDITNTSKVYELYININNDIYNGWLFFILLLVTWYILFVAANKVNDQTLNNMMLSGVVVTILSLLLRAVYVVQDGIVRGLLTDYQMWMFPIATIFLAMVIWATKD